MEQRRRSENTDDIEANHGRHEAEQEKTRALWRRVLAKSIFLLLRFLSHSHINVLIGRIEQCISPVDCGIALRYANNDHHKGALSSVAVHSFV
ncbi:hypothetical protein T12_6257 [Trichinella patagoniensis]|uniref:Uncharacterized protein n=1 Tax=Trichinella patagoniensis TaxID=990121 RepID=A0A0V0ZG18_9BILA|nr:hypothetical protein T12_6257 [Trichinella patagoniensis]